MPAGRCDGKCGLDHTRGPDSASVADPERQVHGPGAGEAAADAVPDGSRVWAHPGAGLVPDERQCLYGQPGADARAGVELAHYAPHRHHLRLLHVPVSAAAFYAARRRHLLAGTALLHPAGAGCAGQAGVLEQRRRELRADLVSEWAGYGRGERRDSTPRAFLRHGRRLRDCVVRQRIRLSRPEFHFHDDSGDLRGGEHGRLRWRS